MKQTYFKQLDHGIYSHIYEHIVARQLHKELSHNGQLGFIDFDLTAESIALNTIIQVDTYTDKSAKVVNRYFSLPAKRITSDEVLRAIKEISIEYARPYTLQKNSVSKLTELFNAAADRSWVEYADFEAFIPPSNAAYSSFRSQLVSYLDRDEKSFQEAKLSVLLDKKFWAENQELTPLATMLIASIAQSFVPGINEQMTSYDNGDIWTFFDPYIRYVQNMGYEAASGYTIDDIAARYTDTLNKLLTPAYLERFVESFLANYAHREDPYFSNAVMNEITQQLIGPKGWQKTTTIENAKKIINNLIFEVKYKRKSAALIPRLSI
jgi:hypothetical protein